MGRLESIKERESKATKGPWDIVDAPSTDVRITWRPDDRERRGMDAPICHMRWHSGLGGSRLYEDAHFIAQARSDIPWLVERLEEAKEIIQTVRPIVFEHDIAGLAIFRALDQWLKSLEEP